MGNANEEGGSKAADSKKHPGVEQATPGSKGYPEPGSGHDESKTVTVEDGPPIKKTDGVAGAFGDVKTGDRQP